MKRTGVIVQKSSSFVGSSTCCGLSVFFRRYVYRKYREAATMPTKKTTLNQYTK